LHYFVFFLTNYCYFNYFHSQWFSELGESGPDDACLAYVKAVGDSNC